MIIKINTQNIQRSRISDQLVISFTQKSNVSLLQELNLSEDFSFQFDNKVIYYNSTCSRTAIIVDDSIPVLGSKLAGITVQHELQKHITDVLIELENNQALWIINLYNPNQYQKQNQIHDQLKLSLLAQHQNLQTRFPGKTINIMLAGDFNNFIDRSDSLNYRSREDSVAESLTNLITLLNLKDSFNSIKHNIKKTFTNKASELGKSRRLDRFYITGSFLKNKENKWNMTQTNHFGKRSTHDSVTVELTLTSSKAYYNMKRYRLTDRIINVLRHQSINEDIQGTDELIIDIKCKAEKLKHMLKKVKVPELDKVTEYYQHINQVFHQYQEQRPIKQLKDVEGTLVQSHEEIMKIATEYYMDLFDGTRGTKDTKKIHKYLQDVIPTQGISPEEKRKMDSSITMEELKLAIDSANLKSTPGIDGIPYKFYKELFPQIKHILLQEFNHILTEGNLPFHYRTILFNIIPKPGKSKENIGNYRPIALINTNLRLLSTIINNRLLKHLPDIIGEDQAGFIPGRSSFSNITIFREMLDSLIHPKDKTHIIPNPQKLILIVDLEKAFDRISHEYMEQLLSHLNFGKKLAKLIINILKQTTGSLYINNMTGPLFNLKNGTLQGNPFSPSLFALAVEPLLRSIKQNTRGHSYQGDLIPEAYSSQHYLAFADDITVFLKDKRDYSKTMKCIRLFEKFSGSKLNEKKSQLIIPTDTYPFLTPFPFEIADENFQLTYLGITIGPSVTFWPETLQRDLYIKYKLSNMTSLLIQSKIEAFNTYIASKFYYKELHQPLLPNQLNQIDTSIKLLVKQDTPISLDTLKTHNNKGGFSMIDLKSQLQHRRAKIFQDLFLDSHTKYNQILRFKIQSSINNIIQKTSPTKSPKEDYIKTHYWWVVLLELADDIENTNDSISLEVMNSSTFSDAERTAYWDFRKVLGIKKRTIRLKPMKIGIEDLKNSIEKGIPEKYQQHIPIRIKDFDHTKGSKKQREKQDVNKMSKTLMDITGVNQKQVDNFWHNLKKFNQHFPGKYQNIHIFHLGIENHNYVNNHCDYCSKKLTRYDEPQYAPKEIQFEIMKHHLIECPLAQKLWKKIDLNIPLTWQTIITPATNMNETRTIDRYLGFQRKLSRLKSKRHFNCHMAVDSMIFLLESNIF